MSIQFRRINGRIVPIDDRKGGKVQKNQVAQGVGFLGAGIATGAAAGLGAARADEHAAYAHNSFRNLNFEVQVEKKAGGSAKLVESLTRRAARARLDSVRATKAAFKIKTGGAAAGAALIGIGTHKILDKTKLDEPSKGTIAAASGIGANFAIRSAYNWHFQPKGINSDPVKAFNKGKMWVKQAGPALKHAAKRILIRGFKL